MGLTDVETFVFASIGDGCPAPLLAPPPAIDGARSGDLTGDGVVDIADLLNLLEAWGRADDPADLDGDGLVGTEDLVRLLADLP